MLGRFGVMSALLVAGGEALGQGTFETIQTNVHRVTGVSHDGSSVVGMSTGGHGWVWRHLQGLSSMPVLSGYSSTQARGISADGNFIAVRAVRDTIPSRQAGRYNVATGQLEMAGLWNGNSTDSFGISPSGGVVALDIIDQPGRSSPGRWTPGTAMELLHVNPNPSVNFTFDVTDNGTTVGVRTTNGGYRAFMYSDGAGHQFLPSAGGANDITMAMAISPNGRFIAGTINDVGAVWVDGAPVLLNTIAGVPIMRASYISDDGSVIGGGLTEINGSPTAWIWTMESGAVTLASFLQARGFAGLPELRSLDGVSPDRRVLVGSTSSGSAFRVVLENPLPMAPIPAPGGMVAASMGALAVLHRRRRAPARVRCDSNCSLS